MDYVGKLALPTGFSVSALDLFGTTALIGGRGSALVYDLTSDAVVATLTAPGGSGSSDFGRSVATRDNRYLVGGTGSAYLYDFNGAPRVTRLGDAGADDRFGYEVALNGSQAAVSSTNESGENAVDVFSASDGGLSIRLNAGDYAGDYYSRYRNFGAAIALGDDIAAVNDGDQVALFDTRTGEKLSVLDYEITDTSRTSPSTDRPS